MIINNCVSIYTICFELFDTRVVNYLTNEGTDSNKVGTIGLNKMTR